MGIFQARGLTGPGCCGWEGILLRHKARRVHRAGISPGWGAGAALTPKTGAESLPKGCVGSTTPHRGRAPPPSPSPAQGFRLPQPVLWTGTRAALWPPLKWLWWPERPACGGLPPTSSPALRLLPRPSDPGCL